MSESALARSVVNRIRAHADFRDEQVDLEIDERAPATAGGMYVIVTYGTVTPGPTHDTAGGVIDKLYGVDVTIALRSPKKPRDRTREFWSGFRGSTAIVGDSFEKLGASIELQIDFDYNTLTAANALILAETGSTYGFIEPLKFAGAGNIREAPAEIFAGTGPAVAAFVRTIQFRGARRIEVRT